MSITDINTDDLYVVLQGEHYGRIVRVPFVLDTGLCAIQSVDADQLGASRMEFLAKVGCVSPAMWYAEYICREGVIRTAEVVLEQKRQAVS